MFDGKRCVTAGVREKLPSGVRDFLWDLIDKLKEKDFPLDSVQVFDLEPVDLPEHSARFQRVTHRQRSRGYEMVHYLAAPWPVRGRVLVVDRGEKVVMMLVNEYAESPWGGGGEEDG